ncbi:LysR family transcriptional regulator [Achromobacter sp. GG226]|uniref:LysR substrate-binding domain-containing protein n=1 Tax=Verticiella alkaliphila TaxID=2779529 RepID=UPI001C0C68C0|nr:LysR substrate-binding domain-containing protein [Verticiella sp. GG226]MBU4610137.1 LysR family transcriptional regulator [Verticiella sp. GG226]
MTQLDRVLRSNIKLRHLQLIVALDEFRHLGRTAEFLAVSQPAVSKMLGDVEAMLDLTLFTRSTRGSEPTPAGVSLVRFARGVLAQYETTREEIAAMASGTAGRTRVGAMVVALPVLLAQAVTALKARAPQATVLVEEGDLTRLLPRLRSGELDVFVGRLEPGYAAPDLLTEALYDEPMVVVVRPGHALTRARRPTWGTIAAQPCVMPPPWASLRVKLEQTFHQHGLAPPTDVIESASHLAVMTFLREREAVGFVARSVAEHYARQGWLDILPLVLPLDLPPVGIITLREHPLNPASERLVACLREAARGMGQPMTPRRRASHGRRGSAKP